MFSSIARAVELMPVQASNFAASVDKLYEFLVIASVISCVLVIGGMVVFALMYKRTDGQKSAYISHSAILEFLWSFIPFVIFMGVFVWSWMIYHDMRTMPKDAFEVHVVGQKWSWNFQYKSGKKSPELYVPVGEKVKLIMTSNDVIHSLYIPGFRIKQDVVPGKYTALWFEATKTGIFQIFCTEFCGDGHSAMLSKINVLPRTEFDAWLQEDPYKGLSVAAVGEKLFSQKCSVCHNTTAETKIGPGLLGIFGKDRAFNEGPGLVADENYLRESILNPRAKIVSGFENKMVSFQGQLSEEEMLGVIEYLKGLK